jgi:hypothetical protein
LSIAIALNRKIKNSIDYRFVILRSAHRPSQVEQLPLSIQKFELKTKPVYSSRNPIVWITLESDPTPRWQTDPVKSILIKLPIWLEFSGVGARGSASDAVSWIDEEVRL